MTMRLVVMEGWEEGWLLLWKLMVVAVGLGIGPLFFLINVSCLSLPRTRSIHFGRIARIYVEGRVAYVRSNEQPAGRA